MIATLLILLGFSAWAQEGPFWTANPHGAIGDIGTLYLTPPGLYLRPMNNDFLGDTDKLLTGAMQTGLLRRFSDSSYVAQAHWRFLTPIYKRVFSEDDLEVPIGRFADWAELVFGYAWQDKKMSQVKHQFSAGIGHVGQKGARAIHVWVHEMTKNPTEQLSYEGQLRGFTPSGGYQTALVGPRVPVLWMGLSGQLAIGNHYNNTMWESYAQANGHLDVHPWLRLAGETSVVAQHLSHTYDDILPIRVEAAAGVHYLRFFQSNFKWVSPYLEGDAFGQVFAEVITFNIPF